VLDLLADADALAVDVREAVISRVLAADLPLEPGARRAGR
jgi:hypothetical protein